MTDESPQHLTVREVSKRCHVSVGVVRRWMTAGLRSTRPVHERLIDLAELDRWLALKQQPRASTGNRCGPLRAVRDRQMAALDAHAPSEAADALELSRELGLTRRS